MSVFQRFNIINCNLFPQNRQSSIVNRQSSIVNRQSSILNRESSIVNRQSSIVNRQSSIVNRQSSIVNRPSSAVNPESGFSEKRICILSVSRFHKDKNFETLIKAIAL